MARVIVLGGGFGGLSAATALRARLPETDEVVVVDRGARFSLGLRKSWTLVGRPTPPEAVRDRSSLAQRGIRFVEGTVTAIDPTARAVEVDGKRLDGEALIVALGAERSPERIPGLGEWGHDVYSESGVAQAARALEQFAGGVVMIGILGAPYTCPPAPYEMACLVQDRLTERGVSARIEVFTPQPMSLPVLGDAGCSVIEGRLAQRSIRFLAGHAATSVERGAVSFASGSRAFDLLLAIPPHRVPEVVRASGLTGDAAWVRVDRRTMETSFPAVYAVGDLVEIPLANGMPLPKAGVFAEAQARVAAEHVAARLRNETSPTAFDGFGYCFLEVGAGMAMKVEGEFLAEPAPSVTLSEASPAHFEAKCQFERDHLRAWFGA